MVLATAVLMHPLCVLLISHLFVRRMTEGGGEQRVIAWVRDRGSMRFARNREGRGRNYVVVEGAEGFKRLSGENLMEW